MTEPLLSDQYRINAAVQADNLRMAFPWHATEEGRLFWLDICKRLERIAAQGR